MFGDLPKKVKTSARRSNFKFPRADQFGESINHDTLTKAAVRASTARKWRLLLLLLKKKQLFCLELPRCSLLFRSEAEEICFENSFLLGVKFVLCWVSRMRIARCNILQHTALHWDKLSRFRFIRDRIFGVSVMRITRHFHSFTTHSHGRRRGTATHIQDSILLRTDYFEFCVLVIRITRHSQSLMTHSQLLMEHSRSRMTHSHGRRRGRALHSSAAEEEAELAVCNATVEQLQISNCGMPRVCSRFGYCRRKKGGWRWTGRRYASAFGDGGKVWTRLLCVCMFLRLSLSF